MSHSGKFVLRLKPQFHQELAKEAQRRHLSLNQLCGTLLAEALSPQKGEGKFSFLNPIVNEIRRHFGENLLGVLLFGSQITQKATQSSDWDLLVALSPQAALNRSLYRWWDEAIKTPKGITINPHFTHLPESFEELSGLWLEVATASKILWEDKNRISSALENLQKRIAGDRFRRYWSNGQPYWVKNEK